MPHLFVTCTSIYCFIQDIQPKSNCVVVALNFFPHTYVDFCWQPLNVYNKYVHLNITQCRNEVLSLIKEYLLEFPWCSFPEQFVISCRVYVVRHLYVYAYRIIKRISKDKETTNIILSTFLENISLDYDEKILMNVLSMITLY